LKEFRDKLDAFLSEIETNTKRFFPQSKHVVVKERLNFLKLRIKLRERMFLDIYFNAENDRKDFALIHKENRIFGYDNLKEWHCHPFDDPKRHIKCENPKIEQIFREIARIVAKL
jgi:hypothetical protein